MHTQDRYYLVLQHLFYDMPKRLWDTARLLTNAQEFQEGFPKLLAENKFRDKTKEELQNRMANWNESRMLEALSKAKTQWITVESPAYPECLRETSTPPAVLFYKGDIQLLNTTSLGIVGSRRPTPYGLEVTARITEGVAPYFTIVSGLALGIDAVAHKTALHTQHKTVGVIGTGMDTVYPTYNQVLFEEMFKKGLVISEFPLGVPGLHYHFPQRNRIIAGLSKGVVVIEAAEKSGALITAHAALDENRDVFAVPGPITSEKSIGPHKLIQQGAKLVMNADDILSELIPSHDPKNKSNPHKPTPSQDESHLLAEIPEKGISIDELIAKSGFQPEQVLHLITTLELKRYITPMGRMSYRKT